MAHRAYLLAGDIGGTHTRLALFAADAADPDRDAPALVAEGTFASAEADQFEAVLARFMAQSNDAREAPIVAACLAVAGPVRDGRVHATNLPWHLSAAALSASLGAPVELVNDVAAAALGVPALCPEELVSLQAGAPPKTPAMRAVLSAGTGLGAALLAPADGRWLALPSEAGHVEFAPRDERQIALLRATRDALQGRVSVERLASGSGLAALYTFVRAQGGPHQEHPQVAAAVAHDSWAAGEVIGAHPDDPLCARTLALFVEILGAVAGDLVLTSLALGGLYLAGGIPPKLLPQLRAGAFLEAFSAKGRHAQLLRDTPVDVVLNPRAGLLGAARRARELAP